MEHPQIGQKGRQTARATPNATLGCPFALFIVRAQGKCREICQLPAKLCSALPDHVYLALPLSLSPSLSVYLPLSFSVSFCCSLPLTVCEFVNYSVLNR